MTSTVISQVAITQEKPIDREKVCPLLLRIFVSTGRHNPMHEYGRGGTPANELQVYTWMDCSLRELTSLIKEVNPDARRRGTLFHFAVVSPDRNSPRYASRDLGGTTNGIRGMDDNKTLSLAKFEVGDYIDCAITLPRGERRFGERYDDRNGFGGGQQRRGFSPSRRDF